jgi:CubicO group peptidase (beta-lactamase class C family)
MGLFWAKYTRRIFAIVSTTSIPDLAPVSPTEATVDPPSQGSRLDADHPERGPYSTPIHTHPAYVADGFLDEDLSNASFVDRLAALPLEHQPGTVWHYSHATDVLGRVLEVVSGHSLLQVLQEALFEPIGMLETGFQLPAAKRGRVAEPLPQPAGGRPQFFDPCLPRRAQRAGGGLVSTAHDYARFLRMLLGDGSLEGTRFERIAVRSTFLVSSLFLHGNGA